MTRNLKVLAVLFAAAGSLVGCSRSDWKAVSYERGDTTVVRTVAGSSWDRPATLVERARIEADPVDSVAGLESVTAITAGPNGDVYLVDGERPAVRRFDRHGRYERSFVVPLGEPGHYVQPNGVAVLSDGRVVIRDPRRSQLVVYSPRGVYLERWPHPSGVYSPLPLISDAEDRLYTRVVYNPADPKEEWREGLVRYGRDGSIEDTIPDPEITHVPPSLFVVPPSGGDTVRFPIPLTPRAYWAPSPSGEILTAVSDRYAVQVAKPDGRLVRIEREYTPVPASREERFTFVRDISRRARQIDYRWTWRGPAVPEQKPPFKGLFADSDGRIWVQLHQPAELIGDFATGSSGDQDTASSTEDSGDAGRVQASDTASSDLRAGPATEEPLPTLRDWREPIVFDVFEPDGRYLGQVSAPPEFRTQPLPSIRGSTVWAAVQGQGRVPDVVRFEIEH